jgi:hypothetical protein
MIVLHFLNADLSQSQYFPYPPSPKYLLWHVNLDFTESRYEDQDPKHATPKNVSAQNTKDRL